MGSSDDDSGNYGDDDDDGEAEYQPLACTPRIPEEDMIGGQPAGNLRISKSYAEKEIEPGIKDMTKKAIEVEIKQRLRDVKECKRDQIEGGYRRNMIEYRMLERDIMRHTEEIEELRKELDRRKNQ